MGAVKRGFTNLTNFSGRDRPGDFWPFAGVVVGCAMLVWLLNFLFLWFKIFIAALKHAAERGSQFGAENQDFEAVTVGSAGGASDGAPVISAEFASDIQWLFAALGLTTLVTVLFLAAAVTRRLHDNNHRGGWALIPAVFCLSGEWIMSSLFWLMIATPQDAEQETIVLKTMSMLFFNNFLYIVALIVLVIFLIKRGQNDSNRFGPPPAK